MVHSERWEEKRKRRDFKKTEANKQMAKNRVQVWNVKKQVRETGMKRADGGENWKRSKAGAAGVVLLQAVTQTGGGRGKADGLDLFPDFTEHMIIMELIIWDI